MFENVVVGVSDSDASSEAVDRAIAVARASGGVLHIVNAYYSNRMVSPDLPDELRYASIATDPTDRILQRFRERARRAKVRVMTHPVLAAPADALRRVAADEHADLIVVGSKATHAKPFRASVSNALVDAAPCAVLVV